MRGSKNDKFIKKIKLNLIKTIIKNYNMQKQQKCITFQFLSGDITLAQQYEYDKFLSFSKQNIILSINKRI